MDIGVEYSRESYVQKFAGALTDSMFAADPRQSTRSRNYFNPIINLISLLFDYSINSKTQLNVKAYSLLGQRNMVIANPNLATNADTIIRALGSYSPRQINRDYYQSYTLDVRMIRKYNLFGRESSLSGGLKYSSISTDRKQNGVGTTGTDFDLTLIGNYGINLLFRTVDYGAFLENLFRITNKLSVTPGIRYDYLNSTQNGTEYSVYNDFRPVSLSTSRNILLGGIGAQYKIAKSIDVYANYSQAYRPILYSNLIIGSSTAVIDPNLKDASGYNLDIGIRGKIKNLLKFDVSGFELYYGNRIGNITLTDTAGNPYTYTTNAGNALTKGVEAYLEIQLLNFKNEHTNSGLSIFSSYAYNDAKYLNGTSGKVDLAGKTLEDAPQYISRSGINCTVKNTSVTFYYSAVGGSWSDANNTHASEKNPSVGYVSPYQALDLAISHKFLVNYIIRLGVNNLTDNKYFTRRTETLVYLGKGVLPGDGRSIYFTLGAKF
jgi:Fe(3+) dicitrate transport protein